MFVLGNEHCFCFRVIVIWRRLYIYIVQCVHAAFSVFHSFIIYYHVFFSISLIICCLILIPTFGPKQICKQKDLILRIQPRDDTRNRRKKRTRRACVCSTAPTVFSFILLNSFFFFEIGNDCPFFSTALTFFSAKYGDAKKMKKKQMSYLHKRRPNAYLVDGS